MNVKVKTDALPGALARFNGQAATKVEKSGKPVMAKNGDDAMLFSFKGGDQLYLSPDLYDVIK